MTMAQPAEKSGSDDAPRPDASNGAKKPSKTPIWTDRVDEVLVFSDIEPKQEGTPESGKGSGK